jgi:hypothetical protein
MPERWSVEDWERHFGMIPPGDAPTVSAPPVSAGNGHCPSASAGRVRVEPLSALGPVVEGCDFVRWCRDHPAAVSEPLWYAMLSNLARCEGGREAAHAFSKDHPGYTPDETDQKVDHAQRGSKPVTCARIRELGFTGCPADGHGVASPCALGWAQATLDPPAPAPASPPPDTAGPEPSADGAAGLELVSVGTLLGEPDEKYAWVVTDRLPAAGLGLLAGKPKAGKSTAARCLALAVSRGAEWLGHATTRGPVIYLALEEKRAEVRDHFRALGATAEDPIHLLCAAAPSDDALGRLRREAETIRPVLIIIDPLFRFVRVDDGNDYATMSAALEPLLVLARETGAHVLLVHHLGKGERGDGDNVLGSTAIFAAVDTAVLMKRTERYRTVASIQRYGQDLEEITVTLDPVTRDIAAGPPRREADEAEAAVAILAYLGRQTESVDETAILEDVEGRRAVLVPALRRLLADGRVTRSGRGGKGDRFRYAVPGTRIPVEPPR